MEFRRANRSDVHVSVEEEAQMEEETRDYFDGLAPKRHTKPQRSEYSAQYADSDSNSETPIPELVEFQRLEAQPQKLSCNGKGEVGEEFVETEYYKDLNCIDKHHHTTGTGFIKMEDANEKGFSLASDSVTSCHASSKGNPATNDWIPAASSDTVTFPSDKPKRSDN
ncbi:uncharacterized protein LOC126654027 isoform X1 [Mercurialis annua]|uniref:uncharacterized protein LOC126654027 isoform X1 n=1 Tax=Mercurialis annua TaxID=3986 RepID=UPI00215DF717|nr:uncharacterized protein LOC126654027 isoform X1 [Mercurialis annua]